MIKRLLVISMVGLSAVALAACGSDGDSTGAPTGGAASEVEDNVGTVIVRTDGTFDVDSFVAAGWKKSKRWKRTARAFPLFVCGDLRIRRYGPLARSKT